MSYREYVMAAYVVFALMLAWDWLAPRWQVRAALRSAASRQRRLRGVDATATELER